LVYIFYKKEQQEQEQRGPRKNHNNKEEEKKWGNGRPFRTSCTTTHAPTTAQTRKEKRELRVRGGWSNHHHPKNKPNEKEKEFFLVGVLKKLVASC
jgi:hypothetical protein